MGGSKEDTTTLADVARLAGVSAATVSRYLDDPNSIKVKHREPIQNAVLTLNYVPNAAARALASRSSRMIGAIFPRLDSLLFAMVYETLQKQLAKTGYIIVVASSDYDPQMEYEQVRNFIANRVDAILLVGTIHDPHTLAMIERSEIPVLLMACWDQNNPLPQIGFSNQDAAEAVCDYLIEQGHKTISVISGGQTSNDRAVARIEGIRRSHSKHGLTLHDDRIFRCEFNFESGGKGLQELMENAPPPTAIICGSDMLAAGALFEAQRLGIDVPGEISITGFDDTEMARMLHPRLTSMRTPRREVATQTAAALMACLKDGQELKSVELPTELKIRGSSGPPGKFPESISPTSENLQSVK